MSVGHAFRRSSCISCREGVRVPAQIVWQPLYHLKTTGAVGALEHGGPGLRYFRALEHIVFGESYLGYLSLILLFPFLVYGLFRRFLPTRWSLALILLFVATPIGTLFGTS